MGAAQGSQRRPAAGDAGRTLLAALGLVALLAGLLWLGPSLMGAVGPVTPPAAPDGNETATPTSDDEEPSQLGVRVRTPERLLPDRPTRLDLAIVSADGQPLPAETPLRVEADLRLERHAVGWVAVTPQVWRGTVAELPDQEWLLQGFGSLPCDEAAGALDVTARTLDRAAMSGSTTATVPGAACDDVPDAPDTVDADREVRLDDWLARGEAALRAPVPSRPAPTPQDDAEDDDSEEEDAEDEDGEDEGSEDEEADDEDTDESSEDDDSEGSDGGSEGDDGSDGDDGSGDGSGDGDSDSGGGSGSGDGGSGDDGDGSGDGGSGGGDDAGSGSGDGSGGDDTSGASDAGGSTDSGDTGDAAEAGAADGGGADDGATTGQ